MTIGKKLLTAFSVMLFLILAMLGLYVFQARSDNHQLDAILHQTNKKMEIAHLAELATTEMQGAQRGLMLSYEAKDAASAPQYVDLYEKSGSEIDDLLRELEPLATSPEEVKALSDIRDNRASWAPKFAQLASLCRSGAIDEAYKLRSQNKAISAAMHGAAKALVGEQKKHLADAEVESVASVAVSNWTAIIGGFVVLAAGALVYLLVGQITTSLRRTVASIADGAAEISSGADQVSVSSQSLAEGSSLQAASIEETSAVTEEIASMTQRNAETARRVSDVMQKSSQLIVEANDSLGEMQASIKQINDSSDSVSKIIKTIESIAFQTNILALNAAVEAARAGEAGMGFAVVADEVRSLAQRSTTAAHETTALIESSIAHSKEGRTRLDHVAVSIHAITKTVEAVGNLVEEVKLGSEEQAKGVRLIASKMTEMERITQGSAAQAEEGAAVGQQLQAEANAFNEIVQDLHAMVG